MITFQRLFLSNFKSFVGTHSVSLEDRGMVRILGVNLDAGSWAPANGAGKSTLLDAIEWCVFGATPSDSGIDAIIPHGLAKSAEVSVQLLLHDGVLSWQIERTRKSGKSSLSLRSGAICMQHVDHSKQKIDDTQAEIVKLLGMDRRIWRAAVYWAQGQTFDFARATDGERKEILAKLIPELGEVTRLGKLVGLRLADAQGLLGLAEQEHARDTGALQALSQRNWDAEQATWVGQHNAYLEGLRQRGALLLSAIAERRGHVEEAEKRVLQLPAARQLYQLTIAHRKQAEARQLLANIHQQLQGMPIHTKPEAPKASVLPKLVDDGKRAAAELARLQALGTAGPLQQALQKADAEAGRRWAEVQQLLVESQSVQTAKACLSCGRSCSCATTPKNYPALIQAARSAHRVASEIAAQARAVFEQDQQARTSAVAAASTEVERLRALYLQESEREKGFAKAHEAWQQTTNARARVEAQARQLTEVCAQALPATPWTEEGAAKEVAGLETLAAQTLPHLKQSLFAAETDEAGVRKAFESAAAMAWPGLQAKAEAESQKQLLMEALQQTTAKITTIRKRLLALEFWKTACGPTELPSLILSSRVQELTDAANEGVQRLTDGVFSVTFDAISTTKGGELRDKTTLTVRWQLPSGEVIMQDFRDFSGGEKDRIALGTSFGLTQSVAKQAKSKINFLAIDEAFSAFLDAGGRERAEGLIKELAKTRSTVFLVSHLAGLDNSKQLVVQKKGDRSMILSGANPS